MVFTTGDDDGDVADRATASGAGGARWCLECGSELVADLDECPDCGLPLVDENPFTELPPPSDEHAHIEYELDAWAAESRVMLDQLLTGAGIGHVWHGWSLVVREADEEAVDELVEQVEVTTLPTLDPDAEKVAFTLEEWGDDDYDELMATLEDEGIPYEFDINHDLIVLAEHGDLVEQVLEAIEHPDALDADDGGDRTGELPDEGDDAPLVIDPDVVLGGLFVGCDRLHHDARDHRGVIAVAEQGALVLEAAVPYGFPAGPWTSIRERTAALMAMLETDGSTDDEVQEAATELRDALRPYV